MKLKSMVAVFAAATIGVLAFAGTAQATDSQPETKTVTLKITDRDDSGTGTPGVWAKDTLDRKVTVTGGPNYFVEVDGKIEAMISTQEYVDTELKSLCELVLAVQPTPLWKYTVKVEDNGTFVTDNDSETGSPGKGEALTKNATGTIKGGATAVVYAPAHWCSFTGDEWNGKTKPGTETGSTSEFLTKLFSGNEFEAKVSLDEWGWTYERCVGTDGAEKWVNAKAGNSGDVTGKACPSTSSTSTTAPVAAGDLPVTGVNSKTIAVAGAGALVLGVVAILLGRKRRIRTEIE